MFNCGKCQKPIGPKVSPIKKVVETRKQTYDMGVDEEGIENQPSEGWEIVKELDLCKECADGRNPAEA